MATMEYEKNNSLVLSFDISSMLWTSVFFFVLPNLSGKVVDWYCGGEIDGHDGIREEQLARSEFRPLMHVVDQSFFLCAAKFEWEGVGPVQWWRNRWPRQRTRRTTRLF